MNLPKFKGEGFKTATLVAYSCVTFLKKLLLKKVTTQEKKASASSEVNQKLDKLLALKTQPSFKEYQDFFSIAENFLSPLTSLHDFESSLITHLVPHYDFL